MPRLRASLHRLAPELFCSLGLFILYLMVAYDYPSIEDSGEFTLSAAFLGISHPPGYPLFTLLGHLFAQLPFATLAARIHLMTAVFACSSLFLLGRTLAMFQVGGLWRSFMMLGLGLGPIFWSQAITAEVYMLNLFLFSLQLWLALKLRACWRRPWAWAYGLSWGLTLANHWPLAVLGGAAQLLLFWPKRRADPWVWAGLPLGLLLGLSPYLHLLTAHHYSEFLFSGSLDHLSEFASYVFRREYARLDAAEPFSWQSILAYTASSLEVLSSSLHVVLLPALLLGYRRLTSADKTLTAVLTWALVGSNIVLLLARPMSFNSRGQEHFASIQLVPMYSAYFITGLGLASLRPIARPVLVAVMGLLLSGAGWHSYTLVRSEHDSFARDYAYLILDSLPQEAVLLCDGDADAGALAYAHFGEGRRPDVLLRSNAAAFLPHPLFDRYLDFDNGSFMSKKLRFVEEQLKAGRRVFTIAFLNETGSPLPAPLQTREFGLLKEISLQTQAAPPPLAVSPLTVKQFLDHYEQGFYGRRWRSLRENIVSGMCHFLLDHKERHPLMESLAGCKHIEALYLHVNHRDYRNAERLFLSLLQETSDWDAKKRSQLYREFLVNRLAILRDDDLGPELAAIRYQETLDLVWPAIMAYPYCGNKLALNYYEIGLQLPVKIDWDFYNQTFATCSWAHQLKKYL